MQETREWTVEEQSSLEATLKEFPNESYSFLTQCAKIAERLPKKTIRDVALRIRQQMPNNSDDLSLRVDQLLKANVQVISNIRENLDNISLIENIPLMRQFDHNVAEAFALLARLDTKMPPFPVRVNNMYLSSAPPAPISIQPPSTQQP